MRPRQLPRVLRVVGLDLATSFEQWRSAVLEVQTCCATVSERDRSAVQCSLGLTAVPIDSLRSGHIGKCAGGLMDGSGTIRTTARRLEAALNRQTEDGENEHTQLL